MHNMCIPKTICCNANIYILVEHRHSACQSFVCSLSSQLVHSQGEPASPAVIAGSGQLPVGSPIWTWLPLHMRFPTLLKLFLSGLLVV